MEMLTTRSPFELISTNPVVCIGQYNGVNLSMHANPVWSSNSLTKPWGQAEVNLAALLPKGAASEADNTLGKYVEQAIYLALNWTNANTALLDGYNLVTSVADTKSLSGQGLLAVSFAHAIVLSDLIMFPAVCSIEGPQSARHNW